jgi:hypothetical protein
MTWVNWARLRPMSSVSMSPASALLADRLTHPPPSWRCRCTWAGSVVRPSPRRFGRRCSGTRVTWCRTPRTENSRVTDGSASGPAKCERSRSSADSSPASPPYRANVMASRIVVLPDPVGPSSRNRPLLDSRLKSIRCARA